MLGNLLTAQTNYTSHYSRFGIGEVNKRGFADNVGMGYTGIAFSDKYRINPLNSASLTLMDTMSFVFSFGLKGEYNYLETDQISEEHYFANISHLSIAFPITKWWFAGLGIRPFSTMGYEIINTADVKDELGNIITQTNQKFTGKGDINQFYLSQAFKYKKISLGVNVSYLYGSLDKTTQLEFPADFGAYNMYSKSSTSINDFYLDFGLQYRTKLSEKTNMTIGMTYNFKKKIMSQTTAYIDRYFSTSSIDTIYDGAVDVDPLMFPMGIGFGVAFEFDEKYVVTGDVKFTNWKDATLIENEEEIGNSFSTHFGFQYVADKRGLKYKNKINYRVGGYYEKSYVVINDEALKNIGITFGVGFPLRKSGTMFNFGFDLGKYGTKSGGLIHETYVGGHISLSLFDKWFYKRKFD